ncbi:hypothetical protein MUP01_12085 [Candidatus Bathyarchaeota archaeon]|nr:hypothetical protein [Candidatus Bathyarchaeota archaeon]
MNVAIEEEPRVVVGRLLNRYELDTPEGIKKVDSWNYRAMWAHLRLSLGRGVDPRISRAVGVWIEERFQSDVAEYEQRVQQTGNPDLSKPERVSKRGKVEYVFDQFQAEVIAPKTLQYIFVDGELRAVASLDHLLIPPSEVYETARKIAAEISLAQIEGAPLHGLLYETEHEGGIKYALQIDAGDVLTREAIHVSSALRIDDCLNPLSWLGAGGFGQFLGAGRGSSQERMLRIKVRNELEPRLRAAIEFGMKGQEILENKVKDAQNVPVDYKTARILMAAMGLSYKLGESTIKQVVEKYEEENQTQYGLSMAASWVAAHGQFKQHRTDLRRTVEQTLSTIAGVTALIPSITVSRAKCLDWIKAYIKEGNLKKIPDLLKDLE